jgi:hypothetical protein
MGTSDRYAEGSAPTTRTTVYDGEVVPVEIVRHVDGPGDMYLVEHAHYGRFCRAGDELT